MVQAIALPSAVSRFKFDSFLVLHLVIDTYILANFYNDEQSEQRKWVQTLRMLRLLRLFRLVRLLRAVPELVTLIKGMCAHLGFQRGRGERL